MIRLASAIARAEIRRSRFGLFVLAYGLAGALIALAAFPRGPYPIVSEAVRSLLYLGPALMAATALLVVRPSESGMARELFLSGITPKRRRRATTVVGIAAATLAWVCASALTATLVGAWLWAHGRAVSSVGQGGMGVVWWAGVGLASVGFLAVVGSACGCLCRSRVAAIAIVASLCGVPLVTVLFGEFPPALWFRSLLPTGAMYGVFEAYDDVRGAPWFRWGVPCLYLLGAAWVVGTGRRPSDPGVVAEARRGPSEAPAGLTDDRSVALPRTNRSAVAVPIALLIGVTALLGAVAPQRIGRAIPWWLQGAWLEDLARDRASGPVARAYVSAVLARDVRGEARRVLGPRDDALDPVLRVKVLRARHIVGVQYDYGETRPGTVIVRLKDRGQDIDLTVCNVRRHDRWHVSRVSSSGVC